MTTEPGSLDSNSTSKYFAANCRNRPNRRPATAALCLASMALVGVQLASAQEYREGLPRKDYGHALLMADKFMEAWLTRDVDQQLALMGVPRNKVSDNQRLQMSGLSNPHHAAFEILDGSTRADGKFQFRARTYDDYTGSRDVTQTPESLTVTVTRAADGSWRVATGPDRSPGTALATEKPVGYARALAAADAYLKAWRASGGPVPLGNSPLKLASHRLPGAGSEPKTVSIGRHASYEVSMGRRDGLNRFSFLVRLLATGEHPQMLERRISLHKAAHDTWIVDAIL